MEHVTDKYIDTRGLKEDFSFNEVRLDSNPPLIDVPCYTCQKLMMTLLPELGGLW